MKRIQFIRDEIDGEMWRIVTRTSHTPARDLVWASIHGDFFDEAPDVLETERDAVLLTLDEYEALCQ